MSRYDIRRRMWAEDLSETVMGYVISIGAWLVVIWLVFSPPVS